MHRTFIAVTVDPNPAIRCVLSALQAMRRPIKAVVPENLHITLRFLGATDEALFADVLDATRLSSFGVEPFAFRLVGVGTFPNLRRPSVVWVGTDSAKPLQRIVEKLNPRIDEMGFPPVTRPWSSHLTLARVKARAPRDLEAFLNDHRFVDFGVCRISEIDLKSSVLTSAGPRYDTIGSVAL